MDVFICIDFSHVISVAYHSLFSLLTYTGGREGAAERDILAKQWEPIHSALAGTRGTVTCYKGAQAGACMVGPKVE